MIQKCKYQVTVRKIFSSKISVNSKICKRSSGSSYLQHFIAFLRKEAPSTFLPVLSSVKRYSATAATKITSLCDEWKMKTKEIKIAACGKAIKCQRGRKKLKLSFQFRMKIESL